MSAKLLAIAVGALLLISAVYVTVDNGDDDGGGDGGTAPPVSLSDKVSNKTSLRYVSEDFDSALDLIYYFIKDDLKLQGYEAFESIAISDNQEYYYGITYTDYSNTVDDKVISGFLNVVHTSEKDSGISLSDITEISRTVNLRDTLDETIYVPLFAAWILNGYHFVMQDVYVEYWYEDDLTACYRISENKADNYDTSYEFLFDYTNQMYVFNNDLDYESQSGVSLFDYIDYDELVMYLCELSTKQEAAGYYVEEVTITYVSPEVLMAWINSQQKETLNGYDVAVLTEVFGNSTSLVFKEDGVHKAEVLGKIDWTTWLDVGIGLGLLIVSIVTTPVTGGASLACSIATIVGKVALRTVTGLALKLVANTAKSVYSGMSVEDAWFNNGSLGINDIADAFSKGALKNFVLSMKGLTSINKATTYLAGKSILDDDYGRSFLQKYDKYDNLEPYDPEYHFTNEFAKKIDELPSYADAEKSKMSNDILKSLMEQGLKVIQAEA